MLTRMLNKNLFIVALALLLGAQAVFAQGSVFTYQGKLTEAGNPANGNYDMQFKLFDTAEVGTGAQQGETITNPTVQVANGIFTVQLDFTAAALNGSVRYLEIAVRAAGSANPYTVLAPRQPLTSTPYAVRSLNAAAADGLSVACVNCVTSSQIASVDGTQVTGTIPVESVPTGSSNYIQNSTAALRLGKNSLQEAASFNIDGDGTIGSNLIVNGQAGIGIATPRFGHKLDVNGSAIISPGGGGGDIQFGTPNFETGMTISGGNNRADIRFNGFEMALVVGVGNQPPPETNGIRITSLGRVGIGLQSFSSGKLHVVGAAGLPAIYAESPNRGVMGVSTSGSYGVYGDSGSGIGVQGVSISNAGVVGQSNLASGVFGNTTAAGVAVAGVQGTSSGSGGVGVRGDGTTGVFGKSPVNLGIGVTGEGTTGVYGISSSSTGQGVWGESNAINARGVYGTSTNGVGVYGKSTSGPGVTGEGAQGVTGFSAIPNGYGVYGKSTGSNGIGVYGESPFFGGGYGGYFDGNVRITHELQGAWAIFNQYVQADSFVEVSDRNAKTNFSAVDTRAILRKVASLPIETWNFKKEPESVRHIGPMAQDFRAAFGLGTDDKHIATVDVDGVSLAAIQGLYQMMLEKNKQIEQLQNQVKQLQGVVKQRTVRGLIKDKKGRPQHLLNTTSANQSPTKQP